jgi:outer membrane lipoprotein-sorting protein
MGLLDATMPRDRASMEAQFRLLSAVETNATMQVVLEPKSAAARKFMGEILVAFRTNDFSMAVTQLKFADGSVLRNDFTDTKLNVSIPAELFEAQVPPGYKTVEPLRH